MFSGLSQFSRVKYLSFPEVSAYIPVTVCSANVKPKDKWSIYTWIPIFQTPVLIGPEAANGKSTARCLAT
jgi:hypothetical protein